MRRILSACVIGFILCPNLGRSQEISVSKFGATPNSGSDSTAAIQSALEYCAVSQVHVLRFDSGTYDLTAPPGKRQALVIHGASGLTLQGNSTVFRMNNWKSAMLIEKCSDLVLSGISFDWRSLPYCEAVIKAHEADGTVLEIVGGLKPSASNNTVTSMFQYDVVAGRPAAGGLDWYSSTDGVNVRLRPLSEDTAFLPGTVRLGRLPLGTAFVVRYVTYGANAITAVSDYNITLQNVSVYSAPGMAAIFTDCSSVTASQVRVDVPINSGRWISTCADGLHFTSCRGAINVSNSTLRKMGDDAVNVGCLVMTNEPGGNARTVRLRHGGGQSLPPLRVGDTLQFAYASAPFSPVFNAGVVSSPGNGMQGTVSAVLNRDIPEDLRRGAVVVDASVAPMVSVTGCTIGNNRARGFWIQTANVSVNNCTVLGSSGPAAEIRCDANKWWEGTNPSNVSFANSTFTACNYGPAKNAAVIYSYAQNPGGSVSSSRVIENLSISDCDFPDSGTVMAFRSAGSVLVKGCRFPAATSSSPPILAAPSVSLTLSGNVLPEGVVASAVIDR